VSFPGWRAEGRIIHSQEETSVIKSKRPLAALIAAVSVGVMASGVVGSAGAQTGATPTPDCSGVIITDPAGDQGIPQGDPGVVLLPGTDNVDLRGVFFRYDTDSDAKTPVTANIQVTNLSKDLPLGASALSWYVEWTVADTVYYVKADMDDAGAVVYDYGVDDPTTGLTSSGATTGKFFEGENGVVQIRVPQSGAKATDGNVLKTAEAHTSATIPGLLVFEDSAPESGTAKSYTVGQCPGESTAPPATGTTPPASASTTLPIKLITSSAKAAKNKKSKSLSLKLQSTEEVTGIKGTLKKGSTSYGSGKLSSLSGKGTLKLKLKKKLKKGSYKLKLSGTVAGGARSASYKFKVS
jgi:hypothetical protein